MTRALEAHLELQSNYSVVLATDYDRGCEFDAPMAGVLEKFSQVLSNSTIELICAEANEVNSAGINRSQLHVVTRTGCVIEVSVTRINSIVTEVIHDN